MKIQNHVVSGNNFHGDYLFTLRGPADGFNLSASQQSRVRRELCGMSGCQCGGGYGSGADSDSAKIIQSGFATLALIPADQD